MKRHTMPIVTATASAECGTGRAFLRRGLVADRVACSCRSLTLQGRELSRGRACLSLVKVRGGSARRGTGGRGGSVVGRVAAEPTLTLPRAPSSFIYYQGGTKYLRAKIPKVELP